LDWQTGVQVNGKAMIKAGDTLVIAGTPNELPPWRKLLLGAASVFHELPS